MMAYAEGTSVSSERSRAEIETVLRRYGADQFASGWDHDRAMIGFRAHGKMLRFILPLPKTSEFAQAEKWGRMRKVSADQAERAWDQEVRRRWRALALAIKAKLEAVETGITSFEDEFLSHIVMPDGKTVGQHLKKPIEDAYATGKMPALLPAMGG